MSCCIDCGVVWFVHEGAFSFTELFLFEGRRRDATVSPARITAEKIERFLGILSSGRTIESRAGFQSPGLGLVLR